jgi:hypothetical protein
MKSPDEQSVNQLLFNAVAWFSRPVGGRGRAASTDRGADKLYAANPASAAQQWLSRLTAEERSAIDRVLVWAPSRNRSDEAYAGPTILFRRRGSVLVEDSGA